MLVLVPALEEEEDALEGVEDDLGADDLVVTALEAALEAALVACAFVVGDFLVVVAATFFLAATEVVLTATFAFVATTFLAAFT